jgi:hypothetical protein
MIVDFTVRTWGQGGINDKRHAVDFGVKDKHGRTMGVEIHTYTETFAPAPATAQWGTIIKPGTYQVLITRVTRNGQRYGRCQPEHYFATVEERQAEIDRYMDYARRRAVKSSV